jgi:hypothetical protein
MNRDYLFAFAVNENNTFEKAHFGDADKFLVYKWADNAFSYIDEFKNAAKNLDEIKEHGSELSILWRIKSIINH